MTSLHEWINKSLKDAKGEVFKDVVKVEDFESENMGDGQVVVLSDLKRINLKLITSSGEKRRLRAVAKWEAQTTTGREMATWWGAFTTEIRMYSDVLRSMGKMMSEVGENDFPWAECFLAGDNRLLLEDLCEVGYRVVPTYRFLDLNHSLLVMRILGKFHGLALALQQRSQLDVSQFPYPYYARKMPFLEQMFHLTTKNMVKSIRDYWGPEWSSVADRFEKYFEKPAHLVHDAWEATKTKWPVLNHGDFSMRNMLFHYNDATSKPDSIKLIDFQICHYSCLANDLITLLYSSLRPEIREDNFKLLLQTYVSSLSSSCKCYGYDGPQPTVQDVELSIRSLDPVMVMTVVLNMPIFVTSGKVDMQEKADAYLKKYSTYEEAMEAMKTESADNSAYQVDYNDEDVIKILQFELKRFMNLNIF